MESLLKVKTLRREHLESTLVFLSLIIPLGLASQVLFYTESLLVGTLIFLAILLELRQRFLPRLVVNLLGLSIIAYFLLTVSLANLLEDILRTLLLLLSVKLFEKKKVRDYFQIYLLELLTLASLSFYYISLWFFLLLLIQLFLIALFLFTHIYFEEGEVEELSKRDLSAVSFTIGILFLATLLIGTLFFLGLPRLETPLFDFGLGGKENGKTGFTSEISLGGVSTIQESTKVVLRFTIEEGKIKDPENLYIRVITYDYFDGKTFRSRNHERVRSVGQTSSSSMRATLYLQSDMEGYLPTIEYTEVIKANFRTIKLADQTFRLEENISFPAKYVIYFSDKLEANKDHIEDNLAPYLQVPEVGESIKTLAKELRAENELATAKRIFKYFTGGDFKHSLTDLPKGERALEEFLFGKKRGNCEFFAGAMVILLRLNGIPARVIGGFRGAIFHPQGNYYLVLEKFAHAWVEAYIDNRWIRFDPTPLATFQAYQREQGPIQRLKFYLDLVNFYYTKFVIDFDLQKQKRLIFAVEKFIRSLSNPAKERKLSVSTKDWAYALIILIPVALLFTFLLLKMKWKRLIFVKNYLTRKEIRLLFEFEREMKRRGLEKRPWEGIYEFVERIEDEKVRKIAKEFVDTYGRYTYKDIPFDEKGLRELERCLKALKRLK